MEITNYVHVLEIKNAFRKVASRKYTEKCQKKLAT